MRLFKKSPLKQDKELTIFDFIRANKQMSTKLELILTAKNSMGNYHWNTVYEITKARFMQQRNSGQGSWEEFVKLRGY